MLFNLTYDLTFEEFAEAMRHFPLRMKGGANRIIWLVAAVMLGVWIILARSLGRVDPAPPRSAQTMSTAEAFYLLWMVACLFACILLPIFLKRFRQIWHQRVVIVVSVATFLGMCLLCTLAGATPRKIGEAPPGFWTIQRDYLTLTIMLIVILAFYLGALSVERFRGNWNLHYMFHETQTFRVQQDAIERETPMRNDRVLYAAIRTHYETPNMFVLFDGIQLFMIPKRVLGGFNEIENFRAVIGEKLSGRTFAFPVRQVDDKG